MIINKTNGCLTFEEVVLSPQTAYTSLRLAFPNNNIWEVGNGYVWIYFSDIVIADKTFHLSVCFFHEQLHSVDFWFQCKGEKNIADWNEWSEEYELAQQRKFDQWLTEQIGKERRFTWGTIGAYYDRKSATSGIAANYKIRKTI